LRRLYDGPCAFNIPTIAIWHTHRPLSL